MKMDITYTPNFIKTRVKAEAEGSFCSSCGAKLTNDTHAGGANSSTYAAMPTASDSAKKEGTVFIVLGWIFFAISFLFIPVLFGAGAFIMGYLVRKNNKETHGTILMVMAIAGAIIGTLLGMAFG